MPPDKLRMAAILILSVGFAVATILTQHQALSRLRKENLAQGSQLRQVTTEALKLSQLLRTASAPRPPQEQPPELLRLRGEVGVLRRELQELQQSRTAQLPEANDLLLGRALSTEELAKINKTSKPTQEDVERAELSAAIAEEKLADAKGVQDVVITALKVPQSVAQIEGLDIFHALKDPSLAPYQVYLRFKAVCWDLENAANCERTKADAARAALQASPADDPAL